MKLKITNSTIIAKAINSVSGVAKMAIPKLDGVPISTQATLLNVLPSDNNYKEVIEVETTTIDEIVESLGLNKINFIKIDTEGYDSIVLNSGYNTICQFKPILKMENNCFTSELKWLFEMDYIAFKLIRGNLIILNCQDENLKFKGDTYLTPQNQLDTIKKKLIR